MALNRHNKRTNNTDDGEDTEPLSPVKKMARFRRATQRASIPLNFEDEKTPPLLSILLPEIIEYEVAPFITSRNIKLAGRLSSCCATLYASFQHSLGQELINTLLQEVIHANWKMISSLALDHPEAIFKTGSALNLNGNMITMSPVEYAFFVSDKFTQLIFLDCAIKLNRLQAYRQAERDCKTLFDYEPYFATYKRFIAEYDRYQNHEIERHALLQSWNQGIGGAQNTLAPRWLIKLMVAKQAGHRYAWKPKAEFNDNTPPASYLITTISNTPPYHTEIDIFNTKNPTLKLGSTFAISRHINDQASIRRNPNEIPCKDSIIFDLLTSQTAVTKSKNNQIIRMSLLDKQFEQAEVNPPLLKL
jgi:hypothetical protein